MGQSSCSGSMYMAPWLLGLVLYCRRVNGQSQIEQVFRNEVDLQ
jgi:hypothetical protein